jgi:hypothetical protein
MTHKKTMMIFGLALFSHINYCVNEKNRIKKSPPVDYKMLHAVIKMSESAGIFSKILNDAHTNNVVLEKWQKTEKCRFYQKKNVSNLLKK